MLGHDFDIERVGVAEDQNVISVICLLDMVVIVTTYGDQFDIEFRIQLGVHVLW